MFEAELRHVYRGPTEPQEGLYRSSEVCSQILGLAAGFLFPQTLRLREKKNHVSNDPTHGRDKSTSQLMSVFYKKIFSVYFVHEETKEHINTRGKQGLSVPSELRECFLCNEASERLTPFPWLHLV